MKSIFNYTQEGLEEVLVKENFKKFNASQVFDWIYKKKVFNPLEMSNISKELQSFLLENFTFDLLKLKKIEKNDKTKKYLFDLGDDTIECVLMKQHYGDSLCISSEVGCNMGCKFCESGKLKKVRNLTVAEMVLQILSVEDEEQIRIDNVVVMGIGEPFDNFENLKDFLSILINPKGISIAQRKITVSTCGLVPKILEFASLDTQVNLAISLHAPNDKIRGSIMPINSVYGVNEVMNAVDEYIKKTNRRVTIEYILIDEINDSTTCAYDLVKLLHGRMVYVNLIPYNQGSNFEYKRSKDFKIKNFYDILKKSNIEVILRKEMGPKISAACGQLRANKGK